MRKLLLACALAGCATTSAMAAPTAFNGHFYEYVPGSFTWQQALAAAGGAAPIAGFNAHLATITSAAEDNFVANVLTTTQIIWLAGTDQVTEGVWMWAAGPETGQIFFGPGAPAGAFSNWNPGEPNNSGNEDFLHTNINQGNWNDAGNSSSGYVVEYSPVAVAGVPEPAMWAMMIAGFGLGGAAVRRKARISFA